MVRKSKCIVTANIMKMYHHILDTIHSKCMNDNEITPSECVYCLFKCKIYSRQLSKKNSYKLFLRFRMTDR